MTEPTLITYPARPVNGGHLKYALPKQGAWTFEPKYNGWRAILHVPTRAMWNRHGKRLSIASEFTKAVTQLKESPFEWLDVEALERRHKIAQGTLMVLDCPGFMPRHDLSYTARQSIISEWIPALPIESPMKKDAVYSAPIFKDCQAAWHLVQEANIRLGVDFYEGLVAKRDDSKYPIQLSNPDQTFGAWMKHRFVK